MCPNSKRKKFIKVKEERESSYQSVLESNYQSVLGLAGEFRLDLTKEKELF